MLKDDIALSMLGLAPDTLLHLFDYYGSSSEILAATVEDLVRRAELSPKVAARIVGSANYQRACQELDFIEKYKIRPLTLNSEDYPSNLQGLYDAPALLYVKGEIDFNVSPLKWVAFVGTRKMSPSGEVATQKLIAQLSETYPDTVIVSGLAYGIDGTAHRAAIKHGLKTVAVVAHGLDTLYPAQHRELAKTIISTGGAIVTEYPSGTFPGKQNFLARNRIVAGLSAATVVIESPGKGGSLVTADIADSYGREVMAVPGRITDPSFVGCNQLIKSNKANMVESAADIAYLMKWGEPTTAPANVLRFRAALTPDEQTVFDSFSTGEELSREAIIERCNLPAQVVMRCLTCMQINGTIKTVKGMMYIKNH